MIIMREDPLIHGGMDLPSSCSLGLLTACLEFRPLYTASTTASSAISCAVMGEVRRRWRARKQNLQEQQPLQQKLTLYRPSPDVMPDLTITPTRTSVPQVHKGSAAAGRNVVEKVKLDVTSTIMR